MCGIPDVTAVREGSTVQCTDQPVLAFAAITLVRCRCNCWCCTSYRSKPHACAAKSEPAMSQHEVRCQGRSLSAYEVRGDTRHCSELITPVSPSPHLPRSAAAAAAAACASSEHCFICKTGCWQNYRCSESWAAKANKCTRCIDLRLLSMSAGAVQTSLWDLRPVAETARITVAYTEYLDSTESAATELFCELTLYPRYQLQCCVRRKGLLSLLA